MRDFDRSSGQSTDRVHPIVYWAILGFALLLILSMWWGFFGAGYSSLAISVASLFVGVAVGLPAVLWRIGRRAGALRSETPRGAPLRQWLDGAFVAQSGRLPGREALLTLLLPIAAVSLGMLIFAVVLHLAVPGSA